MSLIKRIPGQAYLWIAVILFAASNSIVRKLAEVGEQHLVAGRNPISPCNVLFVSNICALLVLLVINYRHLKLDLLKQISRREWLATIAVAILSGALAPGFIFQALTLTRVTNVILIGRIEPLLILLLSIWLFKERLDRWEIGGALICFIGAILSFQLQSMGMGSTIGFGRGEFLTLIGICAGMSGNIISKAFLSRIAPEILTIMRMGIATIAFFCLAMYLYGSAHFAEAFSPFLWQWMLVYGALIVAIGQFCWSKGLKNSNLSQASLANSFSPIAGVIAAYLILNEKLTLGDSIAISAIVCGLLLSQMGIRRRTLIATRMTHLNAVRQAETGLGFKGV
ncbi:DMT family transporter [Aerosakkonema funiforme]|uniref:DMT family transporter n=1 Tax=Aerosakkonema funiforme TaxID=1246630 RepID=UPI0035B89E55